MFKYLMVGTAAVLMGACSKSPQPVVQGTPAGSASAAVAVASTRWQPDSPDEVTPPRSAAELSASMLDKVLGAAGRDAADKQLDAARHPTATLGFFGLRPDMNVLLIQPHDAYYASLLAPLLKPNGGFSVAMLSSLSGAPADQAMQAMRKTFAADPARYGQARLISFDPHTPNLGTPGSADMVLCFNPVRGWIKAGNAATMFAAMHDVLKPGGVLGVVAYRAEPDSDPAQLKDSPYVLQKTVVELARKAGFNLQQASSVNADPEDARSADPAPVDGDRMTLRFVKPVPPAHPASA